MSRDDTQAPADADLRQALRAGLADVTDSGTLQQRLMAQWQAQLHAVRPDATPAGRVAVLSQRRRAWVGAVAGLLVCAALGWGWWQQHLAEAALAELVEVDVLSQLGAGEI